jgi:sialic acid synthase SpsE
LRSVRPGYGLPPKRFDELLGKRKAGLLDALHRLSGIGE